MFTITSAAGLPQSLARRSVRLLMSIIDTDRVKLISLSARHLVGPSPEEGWCVCITVTQATVRLQQSLMSSSTFYLLAETFDLAEHTSTLPQFIKTRPYNTALQICCSSQKYSLPPLSLLFKRYTYYATLQLYGRFDKIRAAL